MSLAALELLGILMRWAHIASAVLLVGGLAYARLVEAPAIAAAGAEDCAPLLRLLKARFRPLILAGAVGLLASGVYNLLIHPGHTRYYYFWLSVKVLLALHVFAVAWMTAGRRAEHAWRGARLSGGLATGLAVLLVAAYLRRIF